MADLSAEIATNPQSTGKTVPTSESKTLNSLAGGIKFKRNLFLMESGTDQNVNLRRLEKSTRRSEWVDISEKRQQEYKSFLNNYLQALIRVNRDTPSVLRDPRHQHDASVLHMLTSDKDGEIVIDEAKINKFLDNPEGWVIANQLLEYQSALKVFALGLHEAIQPPGQRDQMADEITIRFGIQQGPLNRLFHDQIGPFLNRRAFITNGRANVDGWFRGLFRDARVWHVGTALGLTSVVAAETGALAGLAAGGLPGAAVGAAIGVVLPSAAAGVDRLLAQGVRLDLKQCVAAFNVVHGTSEASYIYELTGVDVNDFQVNGNRIKVSGNHGSIKSPEELRNEVIGEMHSRANFLQEIGVDPAKIDALPQQFIYWGFTEGQPEKSGVIYQKEVNDEFNNLGGLIPGDITGSVNKYMDAQRSVIMRHLDRYIHRIEQQGSRTKAISTLEAQVNRRAQGGALEPARKSEHTQRKNALDTDKTNLNSEKEHLDTYSQTIRELENARGAFAKEFPAAVTAGRNINNEIADIQRRISSHTVADNSVGYRKHRLLIKQARDIQGGQKALRPFPPGARSDAMGRADQDVEDRVKSWNKPLFDQLAEEEKQLNDQIKRLEDIKSDIMVNEGKLKQDKNLVSQAEKTLPSYKNEYRIMGTIVGGWGLTDVELRTSTIDQLLIRINTIHVANPAFGWVENQNERQDLRTRVYHATVEARARFSERLVAVPGAEFTALTSAVLYNFSENQLRTLTSDQIITEIAHHPARPGLGVPPRPAIETAIRVAQARFRARSNALNECMDNVDELVKREDAEAGAIDLTQEREDIETVLDLSKRQGDIYSRINAIFSDANRFTSTDSIDNTFSEGERNAGLPRGYYELMDVLFDYQRNAKIDRNQYFQRIQRILPPDRFAEIMNASLGLGLIAPLAPPAAPPLPGMVLNINNVLRELNASIRPPVGGVAFLVGIEPSQLYFAFRETINILIAEANAKG